MIQRGEALLWHAVRGDKQVVVRVIEGNLLTVRDKDGILWIANREDCEPICEPITGEIENG